MSEKRERQKKEAARAGKLLQHQHCQICSKAIPLSEELCSEECTEEYNKLIQKRKNTLYLFYGMIIVFMVLFVLMLISGQ
jgi:predicted nucleic acid-binding Zn ribbon protein